MALTFDDDEREVLIQLLNSKHRFSRTKASNSALEKLLGDKN